MNVIAAAQAVSTVRLDLEMAMPMAAVFAVAAAAMAPVTLELEIETTVLTVFAVAAQAVVLSQDSETQTA